MDGKNINIVFTTIYTRYIDVSVSVELYCMYCVKCCIWQPLCPRQISLGANKVILNPNWNVFFFYDWIDISKISQKKGYINKSIFLIIIEYYNSVGRGGGDRGMVLEIFIWPSLCECKKILNNKPIMIFFFFTTEYE